MVCWAEAHTQETTWKHPHYDKYRKMLAVARNQKPVAHWKSIAAFRIEFLLSSIFTWEVEATGDYPIVETVENVTEIARIFGIDIQNEPYLVHVLKRALRHYGHAVREKRPVKDVEDFLKTESMPVVVKPVESAGSDGVKLCHTAEEAKEHFSTLMTAQRKVGSQGAAVLCQEFLQGKEYVVDFVTRGKASLGTVPTQRCIDRKSVV